MRRKLDRTPAYVSRATLAAELEVPESKIPKLVERGILPKPIHLGDNIERWDWNGVCNGLSSKAGGAALIEDPYLAGVRNATAAR